MHNIGVDDMSFINPIIVEFLPDGKRVRIKKSFTYYTEEYKITIPEGFVCDGASIPRAFWWLIGSPFTGRYRNAAFLHDYLYYTQMYSRKKADRIFLEAMKILRVFWLRRRAMWLAVRIGGYWPWNKRRDEILDLR